MKRKFFVLAGIEISSHDIRMRIAQVSSDGEIKTVESLRHAVQLGSDTFTSGKISFQALLETCDILKQYKHLLSEYRVKNYRAAATGAIREAVNREYIVDQIKIKTGLAIEVMSNAEKRFLTYRAIPYVLPNYGKLKNEGLLIVDAGSASTQISCFCRGSLMHTQNLKVGSLRIREVLSRLETQTTDLKSLLKEYIDCHFDRTEVMLHKLILPNLVIMGSGVRIIAGLCCNPKKPENVKMIDPESFIKLCRDAENDSYGKITREKGLPAHEALILLPSLLIFRKFLELNNPPVIYTPQLSLTDGIVVDLAGNLCRLRGQAGDNDALSSSRRLAEKYCYDQKHSEFVENASITLFNSLRKLHGLTDRHRLLLEIGAILHDAGKYISIKSHYQYSYQIIKSAELPGLSMDELEIAASVARYHSSKTPSAKDISFSGMNPGDRLTAAKLIAIIRLADALDKSHKQKISSIKVETANNEVIIKVDAAEKPLLEQWAFESKAEFFKEVFGVAPVMKIKRESAL